MKKKKNILFHFFRCRKKLHQKCLIYKLIIFLCSYCLFKNKTLSLNQRIILFFGTHKLYLNDYFSSITNFIVKHLAFSYKNSNKVQMEKMRQNNHANLEYKVYLKYNKNNINRNV